MRLIRGDPDVAAWVAAHIPWMPPTGFGPCVGFGVVGRDGKPLGGVVYNNYQPFYRSIDISGAADTPRWLTRPIVRAILTYPFGQLDCLRVTAVTPRKATSARRFLEKLGFKREGMAKHGFGDHGDAIIYGLTQSAWRRGPFGDGVDGKERPDAPAASRPERGLGGPDEKQRGHEPLSVAAQ